MNNYQRIKNEILKNDPTIGTDLLRETDKRYFADAKWTYKGEISTLLLTTMCKWLKESDECNDFIDFDFAVWQKHGLHRIYIKLKKVSIGYINFATEIEQDRKMLYASLCFSGYIGDIGTIYKNRLERLSTFAHFFIY